MRTSAQEDDNDDDDDDDCLNQSLFDALEPTRTRTLRFFPTNSSSLPWNEVVSPWIHACTQINISPSLMSPPLDAFSAVIEAIDDYPGAKQSGLYLWPAGPALAQFLVDSIYGGVGATATCDSSSAYNINRISAAWISMLLLGRRRNNIQNTTHNTLHIIELGAGCGIGLIVAHLIFSHCFSTLNHSHSSPNYNYTPLPYTLTFTDYDPNTLHRSKKNLQASQEAAAATTVVASSSLSLNPTKVLFQTLKWGDIHAITLWKNEIQQTSQDCLLILGSDLIYSIHVVRPLFVTAARFLQNTQLQTEQDHDPDKDSSSSPCSFSGLFILTQSFAYDEDTEREIDLVCKEFNMVRCSVHDDLKRWKIYPKEEDNVAAKYYAGTRIQVFFIK